MEQYKIACVIVTYNRKQLLQKCLNAVASQIIKPECVYITDNASTDGTMTSVKDWGYYNTIVNGISFKYVLNSKNEGGAGGFYLGMKTAYDSKSYDAIWVMDDDGIPDPNCLKELLPYLSSNDYISPLVLSIEDNNVCAFSDDTVDEIKKKSTNGVIDNYANPFNGVLFSKKYIDIVGFPKKEMFIWGDEHNYEVRGKLKQIYPIYVLKAIHYHPKNRQEFKTGFHNRLLRVPKTKWQLYCLCRNSAYNKRIQDGWLKSFIWIWFDLFHYLYYYNIVSKNYSNNFLLLDAYICGFWGIFSRLSKYKL